MSCPNATGQPVAPKLEVLSNTWTAVSLTMATLHLQWSAVIGNNILCSKANLLSFDFTNFVVRDALTKLKLTHIFGSIYLACIVLYSINCKHFF